MNDGRSLNVTGVRVTGHVGDGFRPEGQRHRSVRTVRQSDGPLGRVVGRVLNDAPCGDREVGPFHSQQPFTT